MQYVLCDKDDADIAMIASRKQIAPTSTGIRVIQVIQYAMTRLTPPVFKIDRHAFVIKDVEI